MKIFAFLSLFFLALPVTVNAQKELLKFEHPLIDAGTMTEDDAPRTFTMTIKPGNDFYRYAAGNWMKNHPLDAEHTDNGAFTDLFEHQPTCCSWRWACCL